MLTGEIQRMRQSLSNLIQSYMAEMMDDYKLSLNWPSEEDVIAALRNGWTPEETYELLKHFACLKRHNPTITTDKGKVLYIDYQALSKRVVLYVGSQDEFVKVYKGSDKQLYVLGLEERYEFSPMANDVLVTRKRIDRETLIKRTMDGAMRSGSYLPALYFFVYTNQDESAECTVRTEWIPARNDESAQAVPPVAGGEPAERAERKDAALPERSLIGCGAATLSNSKEAGVTATRVRPVIDPRVSSLVNKNFRPRGILSA